MSGVRGATLHEPVAQSPTVEDANRSAAAGSAGGGAPEGIEVPTAGAGRGGGPLTGGAKDDASGMPAGRT